MVKKKIYNKSSTKEINAKESKKEKSVISDVVIINPIEDAKEGIGTTLKLITSALTLVSALAWNDAIKYFFDELNVHFQGIATLGKFGYAFIITFITVFIITRLDKIKSRIEADKQEQEEKDNKDKKTKKKK